MDFDDVLRRHKQADSAAQENRELGLSQLNRGAAAAQREFDSRMVQLLAYLKKKNIKPATPTFALKHPHKKLRPQRTIVLPCGFLLRQSSSGSSYSATMLLDTGLFYEESGKYDQPRITVSKFKPFDPQEQIASSDNPYIRRNLISYVFQYDPGNKVRIEQNFGYGETNKLSMDGFFESLLLDIIKEA